MFNADFYPTPPDLAERMIGPLDLTGRVVLEPSAGRGDLVRACLSHGAREVLVCERDPDLRHLAARVGNLVAEDFLELRPEQVSHIEAVVMNPPFSADERHILHAWAVAPAGCDIVALCNASTLGNTWSRGRRELAGLVEAYGSAETVKDAFQDADRQTGVSVSIIRLRKPGAAPEREYAGFYLGPDDVEAEGQGLIPYSLAREVVNRYVAACRIFDEQLDAATRMHNALGGLYGSELAFTCTADGAPVTRNRFRKDLQKKAWLYVFNKVGMEKHATRGLRSDINAFVEQQSAVPFTMRNIYRMIEIVACTQEQRVDRAVEEAFDNLTRHHKENRHNVEGWAHNSAYLFARKFIAPYTCERNYSGRTVNLQLYTGNGEQVVDLVKALCFLTGTDFDTVKEPEATRGLEPGTWYDWGFFRFKAHLKGTLHLEFKDREVWGALNRRVGKIKGYTLPERL